MCSEARTDRQTVRGPRPWLRPQKVAADPRDLPQQGRCRLLERTTQEGGPEGKSAWDLRPARSLAGHRTRSRLLPTGPSHRWGAEGTDSTGSTSHLAARKGQNELRGGQGQQPTDPFGAYSPHPKQGPWGWAQRPQHPGSLWGPRRGYRALGFPEPRTWLSPDSMDVCFGIRKFFFKNSHTTKFTLLKYTIQGVGVEVEGSSKREELMDTDDSMAIVGSMGGGARGCQVDKKQWEKHN